MKFQGVIPALITPLNADESINCEVLGELLEDLLAAGADGFYVAGATGEGLALRPEQRRILTEESIRRVAHRKPCIIQVASTDYSQAIELAKHAEACGADAISATPPLFFKYDEDDVYNYYKGLANAVHIPLMIYYNPAAGVSISAQFAARMFEIDNVTAIKWTSSDYFGMMELKRMTQGEMNIINGPDEMLLMGLAAGADGGIGTTYNFMIDLIRGVYDHFVKGDIARAQQYQQKVAQIIGSIRPTPIIPATKIYMEEMGYQVGNATYPMKRLGAEEREALLARAREAGLALDGRIRPRSV